MKDIVQTLIEKKLQERQDFDVNAWMLKHKEEIDGLAADIYSGIVEDVSDHGALWWMEDCPEDFHNETNRLVMLEIAKYIQQQNSEPELG